MSQKHRRTQRAIFEDPVRSNIPWRDVEALFFWLGVEISEGEGSRVRIALRDVHAVFHRPNPRNEMDKGAVRSVRRFLMEAQEAP